jgi:MFS family permease
MPRAASAHVDIRRVADAALGSAVQARGGLSFGLIVDRNFGPYFVGNFLSNSGTWLQTLAQSVLVYRLTESTFLLGVVNFAQFAAVPLLAPWAGSAADRLDRRRLLIAAESAAAALSIVLALTTYLDLATAGSTILVVLLIGITSALATPPLQALVPSLVERERIPHAVALNSTTFNLARAVGPAAGALVIAKLGITWAFVFNAFSYLALVAALLVVRPLVDQVRPLTRPRLRTSLALVRRDPDLYVPLLVVGAIAVAVDPISTLGPAYAERLLHKPDAWAGYLIGAFGVGAVTTALLVGGRQLRDWHSLALRLSVLSVGLVAFGLAPSPYFALLTLVVAGAGFLAANAGATTRLQLRIEESHRGRIMALWAITFVGLRPAASLLCGTIASVAGVRVATLAMALPAVAATIVVGMLGRRR